VSDLRCFEERPLRLGVSSCLLGNPVRYDGGHRRDRFVADVLSRFVEWVPVCPEVEAGMGTPRPTLRLEREDTAVRLREVVSGNDHTGGMQRFAAKRVRALRRLDLCGYVLKESSPSCGMTRVEVYSEKGRPRREGRGLYAAALMEAYPNLPLEDEGRLNDPRLRESFIERIFAYRRLRSLFSERWTNGQVVAFHTAHELQLTAHSPAAYRALGRLVAELEGVPRTVFRAQYQSGFMDALARPVTRGRNTNVLKHASGYLVKQLDASSRAELGDLIEEYRRGLVPLVVPVTLICHYVRLYEVESLRGQHFLEPHPQELMLRNHV